MKKYDTDDITKALFFAARGGYLGIVEFIFERSISQSRRDDNFSLEWGKVFQQAIDERLPNIFEVINPQCTCYVLEGVQQSFCLCVPVRPELIIHLNLPIIQIFYSQICSLLFKNIRDRTAFSNPSSRSRKASSFVRGMAARKKIFKTLSLYTYRLIGRV